MNQFSVGKVFGASFSIWFKNLFPFLLITLLIYTPLIAWSLSIVHGSPDFEVWGKQLDRFATASVGLIPLLNIFVSAALVYGIVMELQGQHAGIGACIATGMSRFFPVLGVGFMTLLAIVGGLFALVVPGIIVACILYVTPQVAVLERPGVMASLRRSGELTKGHRAEIFVILLVLLGLNWILTKVIESAMLDPTTLTIENLHDKVRIYVYVELARTVLMGSLGSVFASVSYYYLRSEKEGTSANELAKVFE